ncbi:hypothetical protein A3A39_03620 [Candidatus Kaiserbacteria bacterium RIFCSPLOWO2_01_FULL_54_13]|uniref:Uncharacterized protein n=1 Tax=Candidatus Kaiserbacteria bacterium RIFCSPLOWO2_01_FULL_54_13 TaxID=1798512 RepID=A0A1F6EZZ5_9BACT|nr:MAG: hypothetical protein A3A39_03620 [Candidatus Kaiserbacteria bacterium RIFCSPLOWO2_01_FULL_54_13]
MAKKPIGANNSTSELFSFVKKQFELQEKLLEKTSEDIRDIRETLLLHDKRFDELESVGRAVQRAIDKDSVKVIDHERRIARLEIRGAR